MSIFPFRIPFAKALARNKTSEVAEEYIKLHDEKAGSSVDVRKAQYAKLSNHYYDLVTDFYEYGWGQSFHFAPRRAKESFSDSLVRHERFIASELKLTPGMKVIDVGCGVGGPMREIARHSGSDIIGLNYNSYQLINCKKYNQNADPNFLCSLVRADFMKIPLASESLDAAYSIEATCHAPEKIRVFREIFRVLKHGGCFAGYEWCMTNLYDRQKPRDVAIKKGIEEGNGLPDIAEIPTVTSALQAAGFKVVNERDLAIESSSATPWYRALQGRDLTLSSIARTPVGRLMTYQLIQALEFARVVPKGTHEVSTFLNTAADSLVAGGRLGIFTPMYYFLARKP